MKNIGCVIHKLHNHVYFEEKERQIKIALLFALQIGGGNIHVLPLFEFLT